MESLRHFSIETAGTVHHLKWLLASLRISGAKDFPKGSPHSIQFPSLSSGDTIPRIDPAQKLASIKEQIGECRRCRLHEGRSHLVFGEGSPTARLVFVGEAPGFDEDRQGIPFVGRAGKLLNKMIDSLGLTRDHVYICNVVKCRPPRNRTPNADEIEICSVFLIQQLMAIKPEIICALGNCAAQTLLETSNSVSRLRGRLHQWRGIPLICTFHPAYLLRNPSQKAAVWQDLHEIYSILNEQEGG
ncbi:MAG: uracil-DNA glycosylase [Deltaproteobacteria bacterium]|jgi:DNA polymerase|nr:uracil-DNA glycosylase [Deltaproteobacteria bacterium]